MQAGWRWAGALSVGSSHLQSGLPCQDHAVCLALGGADAPVIAAIVSDGASSASHAEIGSRLVCGGFARGVSEHFRRGGSLETLTDEILLDWMDAIRERITAFTRRAGLRPRDCAATLVALLVGPDSALVMHVGDGAAVVRAAGTVDWLVPSWPFHGEYASTTAFVTDDPMPPLRATRLPLRLDRFAVFSDGIERMVLDHVKRAAHAPFFDRMTGPVAALADTGRDRPLSRALRDYLDSKAVCERTDDDKSLILGVRP